MYGFQDIQGGPPKIIYFGGQRGGGSVCASPPGSDTGVCQQYICKTESLAACQLPVLSQEDNCIFCYPNRVSWVLNPPLNFVFRYITRKVTPRLKSSCSGLDIIWPFYIFRYQLGQYIAYTGNNIVNRTFGYIKSIRDTSHSFLICKISQCHKSLLFHRNSWFTTTLIWKVHVHMQNVQQNCKITSI